MVYEVTYFEDGKLVVVRVKAPTGAAARRKADELVPYGAHLTTRKVLRSGPRTSA